MKTTTAFFAFFLALRLVGAAAQETQPAAGILLGTLDSRFTLSGKPTFLYGISYYGALSAPEEAIRRDLARTLDPQRLVTASHAGDISADDLREYLITVRVDFLSPHRPRDANAASQTREKSAEYLATMKQIGRIVPLHYQEPFRRGFAKWQPRAEDFVADLNGARAGGAAGWCFHNGDHRAAPDGQPRRSFDLRERRLFEQLDDEERRALKEK